MNDKKSIMLYLDAIEQWDMLSDVQAGQLIKALLRYGRTGEQIETSDGALKMAFSFMTAQIDRDNAKWEQTREKRREAINKRWSNTKNTNEYNSIQKIQMNTNDTVTDTVTDTVKVTVTDTVNNNIIKKEKVTPIDKLINDYTESEDLKAAIKDFIKFRKAIKAPLTDRALTLCFIKLDQLGQNDTEKISVINQSIERGWKGLFPLKDKGTTSDDDYSAYNAVINQFM